MYRRLAFLIAVFWVLVLCMGVSAGETSIPEKILIICDYTPGAQVEAAVHSIASILTYMSKNYDLALPDESIGLDDYSTVFLLIDPENRLSEENAAKLRRTGKPILVLGSGGIDQLSDDLYMQKGFFEIDYPLQGDLQQTYLTDQQQLYFLKEPDEIYAGTIRLITQDHTYPLCASRGNLTQIAWYAADPLWMPYAAADLITQWMWPYEDSPHQYGTYLVLDSVYPFEDLELLMQVSDMLEKQSVPYAIMVMPIYDNATYPAMKRFCEYLRYVQSRGAAIVLRTPLVRIDSVETDELKERIQIAYEAYTQYGVYPLALAAPEAYMHLEEGLATLGGVRTVLLFETDDEWTQSDSNLAYHDGHAVIAPAYTAWQGAMFNAYPTAVYLDIHKDMEALRKQVLEFCGGTALLGSLWELNSILYIGPYYFVSNGTNDVYFDGTPVSLDYVPFEYDNQYIYERGFIFYLSDQIGASNRLILVLVFFFSIIFILMILTARRRMKRQFFVRPSTDGKKKSKR